MPLTLTNGPEAIIDPGANLGWYRQHEQGHHGKSKAADDDLNDDDDDDDTDDDDDDDEDDDPDADKDEETLRAELKAVRESLSKASGSGKTKRDRIKTLERELAAAKAGKPAAKPKADDDKPEVDADAIRAEATTEAEAKAKRVRISDKAELALARADVTPGKLAKAVRLLDLDDLDLNADGTLDGFDEQLDELKKEWPELFTKTRRKRESVAGENDRNGNGKPSKAKSASELQAAQLIRR